MTPGVRPASSSAGLAAPTVCMAAAPTPAILPRLPDGPCPPDRPGPLAYALLLPSKSGPVILQRGRSVVLPLFTAWDRAAAFLVAARMTRCWIKELPTEEAVAEFLRSPPGRTGTMTALHVTVDPADPMSLSVNLFLAASVIQALRGGCT